MNVDRVRVATRYHSSVPPASQLLASENLSRKQERCAWCDALDAIKVQNNRLIPDQDGVSQISNCRHGLGVVGAKREFLWQENGGSSRI
jgi:hypothetical protein